MKIVAVVQAIMRPTRLPNKVIMSFFCITMIGLLLNPLVLAKRDDQIVLAKSIDERNLPLLKHVRNLAILR